MISSFSAPGGSGGSGGAAASPPKKSILSRIKIPLIIGASLILLGLFSFYGYGYIREKLKQSDGNRDQLAALEHTVKKLQQDLELLKKTKPGETSENVKADAVQPVKPPEATTAAQPDEKMLQKDVTLPVFKMDSVGEVWKEVRLLQTELDLIKDKCCNEAESVKKEADSFRSRLNTLHQGDFTQPAKPKVKSHNPDTPARSDKAISRFGKSLVVPKEDENNVTATVCFNDPVRVLSGQALIKLSGLIPGPLASFELTLPNSNVHHLRIMETGSRRPFECDQQGYFFDFIGIEGNCAKVEITKRLSF